MILLNISYTIFFGHHSFWNFIAVILESIFFDFLLATTILSSIFWYISNKYLSINSSSNNKQNINYNLVGNNINNGNSDFDSNKVEWLYSFDVHCNSYFIYFIISNVLVLILSPILLRKSLFSLILGNSIYLASIIAYFYVTFLGYDGMYYLYHISLLFVVIIINIKHITNYIALPIIQQSEKLLYPLPIVIILYVISMLCHFSIIQSLLHYHYGYHAG